MLSPRLLSSCLLGMLFGLSPATALGQSYGVQCPAKTLKHPSGGQGIKCMHLSGGDGFVTMADSTSPTYIFGFSNLTGITDPAAILEQGTLAANEPAPTIAVDEGDELFLTLSNVAMAMRPDLFDGHTVHWHGFAQAASIFDGLPDASIAVIPGASMSYYYNVVDPGTYMYHCHVEAAEHMQMGMLGNLYVRPAQNRTGAGSGVPRARLGGNADPTAPLGYAYNDGDGSTRYDVEYPIQMAGFDPDFHQADLTFQPLPFSAMKDRYFLLNGRSYPDTVDTAVHSTVASNGVNHPSQPMNSLITARAGQRILLRISNLSVTQFSTLATLGLPMQVVGIDARLLKDDAGTKLYYTTNSVTIGGGQTVDAILDTTGVAPGTYFLYTTNLHHLANDATNFGGMMTEIRIN